MRLGISLALMLASSSFTSCSTYRVDGVKTFGHIEKVSPAEIELAIAAYHRKAPDNPNGRIRVESASEIWIYWGDSDCCFTSMVRDHGQWRFNQDNVLWTE